MANEDMRVLGKITTAFGIKGWVKVYSYTDPLTNLLDYPIWHINIDGQWKETKVLEGKPQGKGLVVSLQGINDRDLALALSQNEIGVPESQLPELEEDEHYWFQLIGLKVENTEGVLLGQVKKVYDSGGGNEVLAVEPCSGSVDKQQRLLPFVEQYILKIDLDAALIQVDWDPDF